MIWGSSFIVNYSTVHPKCFGATVLQVDLPRALVEMIAKGFVAKRYMSWDLL
jgi:hypothetical protein